MKRRLRHKSLVLCLVACALLGGGQAACAGSVDEVQAGQSAEPEPVHADFQSFLSSIWPLAEARGVSRKTFDAALSGLTFDPSTPKPSTAQAEFDRPLPAYLAAAVSKSRLERGRTALRRYAFEFEEIERKFGVPREILIAAWGMESDFGRFRGSKDIIRSLASLAFLREDRSLFLDELLSALVMLDSGKIARDKMKGSWAGAMGDPQFLPSAYLKYGVGFTGSAFPDIWDTPPDSLASIANFLAQSGWQRDLPWGMEIVIPANFDFASLHRSFPAWASLGLRSADARALPDHGEATLFLPSGAQGPAFLLSDNYWVLKQYNNSDSYALSLAWLAHLLRGGQGLHGQWPMGEPMLSRTQKAEIQHRLEAMGFYKGVIDGRFGQTSRDAIHAYQISIGEAPADGYASPALLLRLTQDRHDPR